MKSNRREILKSIGGVLGAGGPALSPHTLLGDDKSPREDLPSNSAIGMCVRKLGHDRIQFGTDSTMLVRRW